MFLARSIFTGGFGHRNFQDRCAFAPPQVRNEQSRVPAGGPRLSSLFNESVKEGPKRSSIIDDPRVLRALCGAGVWIHSLPQEQACRSSDSNRSRKATRCELLWSSTGLRRFQLLEEKGNSYIDFSSGGYGHRRYLEDQASGLERPAAVIVETVQIHGSVRVASERCCNRSRRCAPSSTCC